MGAFPMTPEQLVTRTDPAVVSRLAAIAAASGQTISEIVRRCIDKGIESEEAAARRIAETRAQLPHGVTETNTGEAFKSLLRRINRSEPITLPPSDLFTPASRAIYQFLAIVWHDAPLGDKSLVKVAEAVAALKELTGEPAREKAAK